MTFCLPTVTHDLGTTQCGDQQNTVSEPATAEYQIFTGSYEVTGTSLEISYDMYDNPDRLQVYDESGKPVYDSGYVGVRYGCSGTHPTLVSSGWGCQGLAGPSRYTLYCPTESPITLSVPYPQRYSYTVTSACPDSTWALLMKCS